MRWWRSAEVRLGSIDADRMDVRLRRAGDRRADRLPLASPPAPGRRSTDSPDNVKANGNGNGNGNAGVTLGNATPIGATLLKLHGHFHP
ncbi:MAG: hypothetical protein EOO28_08980 [Comamonadaceae bacterium]|nr:MAG: hypothetical protein EOO28_08980 [Comamonadaceae bacterium]